MSPKSSARYQMVYMRAPFAHLDPMQRLFALTVDGSESLTFPAAAPLRWVSIKDWAKSQSYDNGGSIATLETSVAQLSLNWGSQCLRGVSWEASLWESLAGREGRTGWRERCSQNSCQVITFEFKPCVSPHEWEDKHPITSYSNVHPGFWPM